MCQPFALCQLHVRENSTERRVLRAAGINAELKFTLCYVQMAHPHLVEDDTIFGSLDAEIILPAAEAIPHGFYAGRNLCCCPI